VADSWYNASRSARLLRGRGVITLMGWETKGAHNLEGLFVGSAKKDVQDQIRHICDRQGQIVALAFRQKSIKPCELIPLRSKTERLITLRRSSLKASGSCAKPLPRKEEQLESFQGLLPERQGQNLVLTVLNVLSSFDSGGPPHLQPLVANPESPKSRLPYRGTSLIKNVLCVLCSLDSGEDHNLEKVFLRGAERDSEQPLNHLLPTYLQKRER